MCVHLNKEDNQKTMTITDKIRETTKNKRSAVHEDKCIGINYAHTTPNCFKSLRTLLLDFALYFVLLIQLLSMFPHIHFSPVCEFLVTVHTAKTGLLRCCIYTLRRLQQTDVSCKRSNCNKNLESRHVWCFSKDGTQQVCPFYHVALHVSSSVNFLLYGHELNQESLHCHQLEEELDDWCHRWYFQ